MKAEVRTLAFDDGPYTRADGRVPVVGVHMRGAERIEGVFLTDVERDGDDSTNRVARCVTDSGLRGLKAILLDGASFAGFNVVDLDGLREETGIPCLAFTRGVPDLVAMRAAIQNVSNPDGKWALLERRRLVTLPTATAPVSVSFSGMSEADAVALLAATTVRGYVPEPLRVAHLIASIAR